jgi:beta-lactamase superfamily II metal-dependent hydrolase
VRFRHYLRVLALSLAAAVCVCAPWAGNAQAQRFSRPGASPVTVEVLDVGQGDSILIRSPEGKTALIDAGPTKNAALSVLKQKGITSLDLVAISHHHSDHYGGMDAVVKALKPRYFLASKSGHSTSIYLKLLKTVEAQGLSVIQPTTSPRKIELGSVELTLFPQPPEDRQDENNNSIGLRLQYRSFSVLLTGDSEASERQWWLRNDPTLPRDCTILKLPHHGSRNGTDARWLKTVRPELAVGSMGRDNEYGHPHYETISLLRSSGIPFLRTDQLGTITITSDGSTWHVTRPALPSNGRVTQADVDRIAAATEDVPKIRKSRTRTR